MTAILSLHASETCEQLCIKLNPKHVYMITVIFVNPDCETLKQTVPVHSNLLRDQ